MAGQLRGGRGVKEKITFFGTFFFQRSTIPTAIKLEGGKGGLGLNGPLREDLFFATSLTKMQKGVFLIAGQK